MLNQRLGLLACVGLLTCTCELRANDIAVLKNGAPVAGSPFPSGVSITIAVGAVSAETLIQIFDANPGTTGAVHSVGKIILTGHIAGPDGRLSVLIARNTASFPGHPESDLFPAILHFGTAADPNSLEIIDDTGPTTNDLRDHTRLAMAVRGDIHGTIAVGSVFRIQADGVFDSTTLQHLSGGTIDAAITAYAFDYAPVEDVITITTNGPVPIHFNAIERIRAGWSISGPITAAGYDIATDPTFQRTEHATIAHIFCGRSVAEGAPQFQDAVGITGDIRAETGTIEAVLTTGPIGRAAVSGGDPGILTKIWAGKGIGQVRAVTEDAEAAESTHPSKARAQNFRADIRSNRHYAPSGRAREDAPLRLVQTDGSFAGSIKAGNPMWGPRHLRNAEDGTFLFSGVLVPQFSRFHAGILVPGAIDAPSTSTTPSRAATSWHPTSCSRSPSASAAQVRSSPTGATIATPPSRLRPPAI